MRNFLFHEFFNLRIGYEFGIVAQVVERFWYFLWHLRSSSTDSSDRIAANLSLGPKSGGGAKQSDYIKSVWPRQSRNRVGSRNLISGVQSTDFSRAFYQARKNPTEVGTL